MLFRSVHFSSSDSAATLAANAVLTNGSGTFQATMRTGGSQTVTAADTANSAIAGTSSGIAVMNAGPATHFVVSAPPAAGVGVAFSFTVTALDASNNVAPSYSGTVRFTSNGYTAVLPPMSTLSNGVGTFTATLSLFWSPPVQTITAADTVNTSINGTSNQITVSQR